MGLKISDIKREERTTTISFDSGDLNVTYRPNVFTPATIAELASVTDGSDNAAVLEQNESFVRQLCELLVNWDLIGDDGEVIPIEPEAVAKVPLSVFQVVMRHIGEENRPEARRRSRGS